MKNTTLSRLCLAAGISLIDAAVHPSVVFGQITTDSINHMLTSYPSFTIHKDNYFIFGAGMTEHPLLHNPDIKFQVSVRQRLTDAVFPFRTYLSLTYTQVSFSEARM